MSAFTNLITAGFGGLRSAATAGVEEAASASRTADSTKLIANQAAQDKYSTNKAIEAGWDKAILVAENTAHGIATEAAQGSRNTLAKMQF